MNNDKEVFKHTVSVIVPMFNAVEFIERCLSSVYSQTYSLHEVIVVDDGSSDGSGLLVSDKFPGVSLFSISNKGAAGARNYGVKVSSGNFIAFIDADDVWHKEKIAKQMQIFRNQPSLGMVFSNHYFISPAGVRPCPEKRERLMKGDIVRNIFELSGLGTPTVVIKKSVFVNLGGFDERLVVGEDDNLWIRVCNSFEVDLVDDYLVDVYWTESSLSRGPEAAKNFYEGGRLHLDILRVEQPEIFTKVEDLVKTHYQRTCFSFGYYCVKNDGDMRMARDAFLKGICAGDLRIRTLLYLIISLFGEKGRRLQRLVRRVVAFRR